MLDPLDNKITEYYKKLTNPSYKIGDWIIADDEIYLKYKNKLTFVNILSIYYDTNESIIVAESKNKYYAIKYNHSFVCLRESDNEYGLATGEYQLVAINAKKLEQRLQYPNKNHINNITLKDLAKLFGWKLGKKAKEYLDYNK